MYQPPDYRMIIILLTDFRRMFFEVRGVSDFPTALANALWALLRGRSPRGRGAALRCADDPLLTKI